MPAFRSDANPLRQHREIHRGMEKLEAYLRNCQSGQCELIRENIKAMLDVFGKVLWEHLDEEVVELGAEKMKTFWKPEEMHGLLI